MATIQVVRPRHRRTWRQVGVLALLAVAGCWATATLQAEPLASGISLHSPSQLPAQHTSGQRLAELGARPERLAVPGAASSDVVLRPLPEGIQDWAAPLSAARRSPVAGRLTINPDAASRAAEQPPTSGVQLRRAHSPQLPGTSPQRPARPTPGGSRARWPVRQVAHSEPQFIAPGAIAADATDQDTTDEHMAVAADTAAADSANEPAATPPLPGDLAIDSDDLDTTDQSATAESVISPSVITPSVVNSPSFVDSTDVIHNSNHVNDIPQRQQAEVHPPAEEFVNPVVKSHDRAQAPMSVQLVPVPAPVPNQLVQFDDADQPLPSAPVEMRGPFEVIDASGELKVMLHRSKLLRTKVDIYRTAVVDPRVCNVVQFTPREISVIGLAQGATHVTFWFEDGQHEPLTYLVRVEPDPDVQKRREEQYQILEEMIAELFPDSKVKLVAVSDKLLVKGQARDAEEAAQIMAVIRGQAIWGNYQSGAMYGSIVQGTAAPALIGQEEAPRVPAGQVINMLMIPGEQQVMLRVKIAELNRSAARRFGVDLDIAIDDGNLLIQSMLNAATGSNASIIGMFDGDQVNFGIHYLEQHGVLRLLSEPTLVTLSGRPASFLAGGEFAVPTTVGVAGAAAVTTDFRAFGAIITFMPVVLDKDLIRLQVAPEFSQVDNQLSVNGTPGLNTRSVTTTVEMREGQTLAVAGLLDDTMSGNLTSDLPWVSHLLGRRSINHNETELVILVTPELVHPLDPEEVPPLPGFDVTEPTNTEFFLKGQLEGRPTLEYRSTIWPRLRRRYTHDGPAMISGPFGHGQ